MAISNEAQIHGGLNFDEVESVVLHTPNAPLTRWLDKNKITWSYANGVETVQPKQVEAMLFRWRKKGDEWLEIDVHTVPAPTKRTVPTQVREAIDNGIYDAHTYMRYASLHGVPRAYDKADKLVREFEKARAEKGITKAVIAAARKKYKITEVIDKD